MNFTTVTIVPAALFVALFSLAIHCARRLRGTTLVAPCVWVLISAASLFLIAIFPDASDAARFAAAATTFCPLMAVLGAKRPQDRGWQWVVAALWLVLVWPAGQAMLMQSGELDLFVAWKLFLVGLIALGPLNYLPTRNWFASLLVAAGQALLLLEFLGSTPASSAKWRFPVGAACFFVAAASVLWANLAFQPSERDKERLDVHTRQWRWFRDAYGAFWALRILGRVNETAELRKWPMRLTWQGFEQETDEPVSSAQLGELEETLSTLLRRFVDIKSSCLTD